MKLSIDLFTEFTSGLIFVTVRQAFNKGFLWVSFIILLWLARLFVYSDKLFLMLGPVVLFSTNNAVFQSDAQYIINSFTKHLPIDSIGPSLLVHIRNNQLISKGSTFFLL